MESLYAWATSSLGSSTLNDFVSPVAVLTAVLAGLLPKGPSSSFPVRGLPLFLEGPIGEVPWGNRTVHGTNPMDIPNTGRDKPE